MPNFTSSQTTTGLQATTINIPTTDEYAIVGTLTTTNNDGSMSAYGTGGGAGTGTGATTPIQSQVVVTIRQNGSTVLTTTAGSRGFSIPALNCTAGDVITITPSSSLPQDEQTNAIKMTVTVSEGPL